MGIEIREMFRKYMVGMDADPSQYTGRGNTTSDLNSGILEKIYTAIKTEHGNAAAVSFVNMVGQLQDTSATNFLLSLRALENNGWKLGEARTSVGAGALLADSVFDAAAQGKDNSSIQGSMEGCFMTLMSGMGSSKAGHDPWITDDFLKAHSGELDKPPVYSRRGHEWTI